MKTFTIFGQDRNRFFAQDNNAIEAALKKLGLKSWLETCGPSAICNAAASVSDVYYHNLTHKYKPLQPEDMLFVYLNDPKNEKVFNAVRGNVTNYMYNRIPQFLPIAAKNLFNIDAYFTYGIGKIKTYLSNNKAVIVLHSNEHFLTVVGFDTNNFYINDSWIKNPLNKNGGFNEVYEQSDFINNIQTFIIIVE